MISGTSPAFSPDGSTIMYVAREGDEYRIAAADVMDPLKLTIVRKGPERVDAPAASPDGSRLAFQMMPKDDWEIYTINRDGSGETRVTREIQHDVLPLFLCHDRLLAADRRTATSPLVPLRPHHRHAHAALPQQHRAHDCARVLVAAEPPMARSC